MYPAGADDDDGAPNMASLQYVFIELCTAPAVAPAKKKQRRSRSTKKMPRNSCYKLKLPEFMFRMSKLKSSREREEEGEEPLIPCGVLFKELDALGTIQSN